MDAKNNMLLSIGGIAVLAVVAFGAYAFMQKDAVVSEDETMQKEEAMMEKNKTEEGTMIQDENAMMQKGSYEAYSADKLALANKGDVILFFRATWCPTCRALDADIKANSVPAGVTILDVDYDTETALKQKYGVTTQHTLVQVDAAGTLIQKWQGSPTLASIVAKVN
jgi:thiol-disulfide isomerase/thioredoxin